eukprot:1688250-Rhodomonas_salina.2
MQITNDMRKESFATRCGPLAFSLPLSISLSLSTETGSEGMRKSGTGKEMGEAPRGRDNDKSPFSSRFPRGLRAGASQDGC